MWFVLFSWAGFTRRNFNPRQWSKPGLLKLQSCRIQTGPQSVYDPVINPIQPDESKMTRCCTITFMFRTIASINRTQWNIKNVCFSFIQVHLMVAVVGRLFQKWFPAQPNLSYTFIWDKTDAYGQHVYGLSEAVGEFAATRWKQRKERLPCVVQGIWSSGYSGYQSTGESGVGLQFLKCSKMSWAMTLTLNPHKTQGPYQSQKGLLLIGDLDW